MVNRIKNFVLGFFNLGKGWQDLRSKFHNRIAHGCCP